MNYAAKLEPRPYIVLCLFVDVDIIELRYELECVSHLVEQERENHLA